MKRAWSVTTAFWSLAVSILVVSILSTTLAVRFTAWPFLTQQQAEAVKRQAEDAARFLDHHFDDGIQFLSVGGQAPEAIDLVLGEAIELDAFSRRLAHLHHPAALRRVRVYDALRRAVGEHGYGLGDGALFTDEEWRAAVEPVLQGAEATRGAAIRLPQGQATSRYLIAVPVLRRGHVVGALAGAFEGDLIGALPPGELALETALFSSADPDALRAKRPDYVFQPLEHGDLFVGLRLNREVVSNLGQDLVAAVVLAVSAVLLLPFAFGIFFGRRALVEPHLALQRSEHRLQEQKKELAELAAIAERAKDSIILTDLDNRITWANPAFCEMSGMRLGEIVGRRPSAVLHGPNADPETVDRARAAMAERRAIEINLLCRTQGDGERWFNISISPLCGDDGEAYGFLSLARDVTEQRRQHETLVQAKQQIEHQAVHDALTNLPNRWALDARISERLAAGDPVTLIRIDLDHFKHVNDTLGHEAGDFALVVTARVIRECVGPLDLPARVGGDEFVVLLGDEADSARAQALAEALQRRIAEPIAYQGRTIQVGASFGIASSLENVLSNREVIAGADVALYLAKDEGRNAIRHYSQEVHASATRTRELTEALKDAIRDEDFLPYYQPQICAISRRVVGVETLARWPSAKFGMVFPDVFLPMADRLSLVGEIDGIMLRKALADMDALRAEGIAPPKLSLNVTAAQLGDPSVLQTIDARGADAPMISFEIVESVLLDDMTDALQHRLDALREAGASIEIDDFGSGHASVIGLMRTRPDVMKIDKRLVFPLTQSDTARRLVSAIVEIGKSLEISVTAEGVETAEHADILTEIGCDTLQGFHFARPMPIEALAQFLREGRGVAAPGAQPGRPAGAFQAASTL